MNCTDDSSFTEVSNVADDFEKGDVVRLKTGGPRMTVQGRRVHGDDLICKWFDDDGANKESFAPESLEKVEDDQ